MSASSAHARHAEHAELAAEELSAQAPEQTSAQAVESAMYVKTAMHERETMKPQQIRRHRPASYDRGVQVAAAKVRVATDKKLGEKTPVWIVELSREEKSASAS